MDDLLEKSFIETLESNSAHVKQTTREQESCTVLEATDPLAEGNLLLEKRENKGGHAHPRPRTPRAQTSRH